MWKQAKSISPTLYGTEHVGDAQERLDLLARVVEAGRLSAARFVGPHDEVVAVAVGREVAVDELGDEHA